VTASDGSCYLDTSTLTTAIFEPVPHHQAALAYCEQLVQSRASIVVSDLVFLEFWHFLRGYSGRVAQPIARAEGLHRWERSVTVPARWMETGTAKLTTFLGRFAHVREEALTRSIIDAAQLLITSHNQPANDAANVITALSSGATQLAAVDGHFDRAASLLQVTILRDR
jgi:predicted nucleic acid-binding protein